MTPEKVFQQHPLLWLEADERVELLKHLRLPKAEQVIFNESYEADALYGVLGPYQRGNGTSH